MFGAVMAAGSGAVAQPHPRGALALHAELGVGTMLSAYQRETLGYGFGGAVALRGSVRLTVPVSLQLSTGYRVYPADQGAGSATDFTAGVRLQPFAKVRTLFVDGNVGVVRTGSDWRAGFDVGVGLEFLVSRHLRLGPMVRMFNLVSAQEDAPADALSWVVGLSVSLQRGVPPPRPVVREFEGAEWANAGRPMAQTPVSDRDGDGVYDHRDLCPDEPEGDHPDRSRMGCPAGDRDGDGILDPDDACPAVPVGATPDPQRAGCPDGDDDQDGIGNQRDQCPAEAAGRSVDPQRLGCPAPDRDGDTVPDAVDACPSEPGAPSSEARRHGCPAMVTIAGGVLRTRRPVLFAGTGDALVPRSERVLEGVAEVLRLSPQLGRVRVEAHVDEMSEASAAMALSTRRAARVVAWLIAHGIAPERLEAVGRGDSQPYRPNDTRRNREHNRRVEFHLADGPAPAASAAAPPAAPTAPAEAPADAPAASPAAAPEEAPAAGPAVEEEAPGRHGRRGRHGGRSREVHGGRRSRHRRH